jgi:hypothetical protein
VIKKTTPGTVRRMLRRATILEYYQAAQLADEHLDAMRVYLHDEGGRLMFGLSVNSPTARNSHELISVHVIERQ